MLKEVKVYKCDGIPQDRDIVEALDIIQLAEKEDNPIIIELRWFVPYSGRYKIEIDEKDTIKSVRKKLPKTYGV